MAAMAAAAAGRTASYRAAVAADERAPYERAPWLSRWTMAWASPLVALGRTRALQATDLPPLEAAMQVLNVLSFPCRYGNLYF